jgi:hypothetical protein
MPAEQNDIHHTQNRDGSRWDHSIKRCAPDHRCRQSTAGKQQQHNQNHCQIRQLAWPGGVKIEDHD